MSNTPKDEFLRAYKPIHSRFLRYCRSMAYGQMDTQDLVQESVLVALQRWEDIERKTSLLAFLIGTARKLLQNNYRKASRLRSMDQESEALRKMESQTGNPELAMDIHLLHQAMTKLGAAEQECLVLFEISGFGLQEIADLRGEGLSAVKSRISRARQRLRILLEDGNAQPKPFIQPQATLFHLLSSVL
jgi:RNA polymerase sigma-70 factor, ECF subfamily